MKKGFLKVVKISLPMDGFILPEAFLSTLMADLRPCRMPALPKTHLPNSTGKEVTHHCLG